MLNEKNNFSGTVIPNKTPEKRDTVLETVSLFAPETVPPTRNMKCSLRFHFLQFSKRKANHICSRYS